MDLVVMLISSIVQFILTLLERTTDKTEHAFDSRVKEEGTSLRLEEDQEQINGLGRPGIGFRKQRNSQQNQPLVRSTSIFIRDLAICIYFNVLL